MQALTRKAFLGSCVKVVGAVGALSALDSCASPSGATPTSQKGAATTAAPPGTPTTVPRANVASSTTPVTITYWDWAPVWQQLLKTLTTDFAKKYPSQKVNLQIQPNYYAKLQVAFAGGTGPDVYRTDSPNAYGLAFRKVLLDLSDAVASDQRAKQNFDGMAPASRQAATYQGKVVGMPFGGTLEMTIYNADLLQKAGLKAPADLGTKWDWNAAREYANKLTQRQGAERPSVYGFWANQSWEEGWLNFVLANGGYYLDPAKDYRECTLGAPPAVEAVEFLVDLVLKDKVSPATQDLSAENGDSQFFTGKIAVTTAGSWRIPQIRKAKLNFDIAPVPYAPKTGKTGSNSNFSLVGVNPKTKIQDPAVLYALWNGTPDAQKTIGTFEFMPASLDAAQATYFQTKLGPPHRPVMADIVKITTPQPSPDIITADDAMNVADQEMPLIFAGKVEVASALTGIQQKVNAKIQQALVQG